MTDCPHVLLLDDGELSDISSLLDEMNIPHLRLRGGEIKDDIAPPTGLLIATPRRAQAVRRGSPPGAMPGRPVRIIAVEEDSNAMRRMLRQMGFHLLVRRPSHREIWRLLIQRAVYQGSERRGESRVTAGSEVAITGHEGSECALLVDISNRGCRLLADPALEVGAQLTMAIPEQEERGDEFVLQGTVLRSHRNSAQDGSLRTTVVMLFDEEMDSATQVRLSRLLNCWSTGPGSLAAAEPPSELPPRPSAEQPDLLLDDETDPAISAGVDVSLRRTPTGSTAQTDGSERRQSRRASFSKQVLAVPDCSRDGRVLLGRDLSAGGMRVERLPGLSVGDRFRVSLYGPSAGKPHLIQSVLIRDDGEDGFALRFEDVSKSVADELEKMVACLPDVESLESGEAGSLGSVVMEIVDSSDA